MRGRTGKARVERKLKSGIESNRGQQLAEEEELESREKEVEHG